MQNQPTNNWQNSLLFSSFQIGKVHLRNRIVYPPIHTKMDLTGEQARAYYRERARGGAGLVIVEITPMEHFGYPRFVEGLRALVEVIHKEGVPIIIQLFQMAQINGEQVSQSGGGRARAATTAELAAIPEHFAQTAVQAKEVGFDGVELHGAHDFFLNRFFSPRYNRRQDKYGGSLEGRMRLGLDSVTAVRKAVGPDYLVFYRHTPVADYPLEDSLNFATELERAGLDVIDISPSTGVEGEHAALAGAVKAAVSIPVIAVGGMENPEAAEAVLQQGKADLVAIGRALIADPHLPNKIKEGRREEVIECIKCDEMCFGNIGKGIPIGCTQNPETGNEYLDADGRG